MRIVLTKDLNPKKGMIRGASFDWPRQVISEMTNQVGNDGWYKFSTEVERSMSRQTVLAEEQAKKDKDSAVKTALS
jgi:hypothetical protein